MRLPTLLTAALALPLFLAACQPPSPDKDAGAPAAVVTGGEDLVMPDDAPPPRPVCNSRHRTSAIVRLELLQSSA